MKKSSKLAIVCDFMVEIGGAESVLRAVHELYPDAPIYTSMYRHNVDYFFNEKLDVRTGWLNTFPVKTRRMISRLRQNYFNHLNLSDYDLIISITGAEAKGTIGKKHICYCHVPTQYYWGKYNEYLKNPGFGILDPLARVFLKVQIKHLRKHDLLAASRPTKYLTDSFYAAEEIEKYYGKNSKVVWPPVRMETFKPVAKERVEQSKKIEQEIINDKSQAGSSKYNNIKHNKKQDKSNPYNITKWLKNQAIKSEQYSKNNPQAVENFVPSLTLSKKHHLSTPINNQKDALAAQVQNIVGDSYYLNFSRQVTWKHIDIMIEAAVKAGQPLVLVGGGHEHKKLVKLAKKIQPNTPPEVYIIRNSHRDPSLKKSQKSQDRIEKIGLITFVSEQPQERLAALLCGVRAFLFASLEPFGIAPVEALAAGCPVLAYAEGGARDYIEPNKNGLLFPLQTATSLAATINTFEEIYYTPKSFAHQPLNISKSADKFSEANFKRKIKVTIDAELKKK